MTILFYPEAINEQCKLYHTMEQYGIEFHNDLTKPYDIAIYWSYHKSVAQHGVSEWFYNYGCTDVSKTRIDNVFKTNLIVNPETYTGKVVRKTEDQCSLDEVVIDCPAPSETGYIYRRFINTFEDNKPTDLRMFYFGSVFFICKKTYLGDMFDRHNYVWELVTNDVIPQLKRLEIISNCYRMGFHIGEIDILRDSNSGECFVIDINNVSGIAYNWNYPEYKWLRDKFNLEFLFWVGRAY